MRSKHDPHFDSGLKIISTKTSIKFYEMGSRGSLVTILATLVLNTTTIVSLLVPLQLSACGIFDLKGCFDTSNKAEAEEVVYVNSQNMALLQATISPTQATSSPKSEIAIVDDLFISNENQKYSDDAKTIDDAQISVYVVRAGDTLPSIAKMFGVTVNTIRWGNDLKNDKLTPGETLVILPISGVQHTVKSGETLQGITKLHKGDLNEVMQYNNLTLSSKLSVGDVIIIPDGEITTVVSTKKPTSQSKGTPTYSGYYMRPITGGIRTQGIHGHNGVDLASVYGANILASASGEVIIARVGWNGGYGTYVVIKHGNGTQTLYGHMSALSVKPGDKVSQGQVIGKMGSTGKSTGVHLHFEIRGARNPF